MTKANKVTKKTPATKAKVTEAKAIKIAAVIKAEDVKQVSLHPKLRNTCVLFADTYDTVVMLDNEGGHTILGKPVKVTHLKHRILVEGIPAKPAKVAKVAKPIKAAKPAKPVKPVKP